MTELSIIIVSYNTEDLLKQCLDSIFKYLKKISFEVIVIDNHSTDGSAEMLKKWQTAYPKELTLILNDENAGFSKANNQGIKQASGSYLLLLNPDTKLIDNSFSKMLEFAKTSKDFGIGGPQLLNNDGTSQVSVFSDQSLLNAIKEFWLGKKDAFMLRIPKNLSSFQEVDGVIGAVFLIPRKIIGTVGLLEEKYFFYYEDLDFCRRVKKSGYKVYYFPETKIIHFHGASSSKSKGPVRKFMIDGSKRYHGLLKYWLLYFILWSGQKFFRNSIN